MNQGNEAAAKCRMIYWMNVSLDLRIEHAPDEQGAGEWIRISEELHREFNHGLLDELLLFVHPTVLDTGRPLFDDGTEPIRSELLEQASFPDGVVMHRYAIRR